MLLAVKQQRQRSLCRESRVAVTFGVVAHSWLSPLRGLLVAIAVCLGCDGVPSAVSPAPGRVLWQSPTLGGLARGGWLAADSARVYAYVSDNVIGAAALSDGSVAWTAAADESLQNGASFRGPTVCGGVTVFSSYLAVYGVASQSGARLWRRPDGGAVKFGVGVCRGSTLFHSGGGTFPIMRALDVTSGVEIWRSDLEQSVVDNTVVWTPAITDSAIAVCTRRLSVPWSGEVIVLERFTGRIRWRFSLPARVSGEPAGCSRAPAIWNDLVISNNEDGRLFALDLRNGAVRWIGTPAYAVPAPDNRPLVIVGSSVIAGSLSGTTISYDAATGAERWRFVDGDGVRSVNQDSWTTDGRIVVGTNLGGGAFALDVATGRRLWSVTERAGLWPIGLLTPRLYVSASTTGLKAFAR